MLKFYCTLIGENYNYVKNFQPASKRKIALVANCLLIPVIMWFINGFLLVSRVLEGTLTAALLTAIITAFIIFLIERAVIMSNGSKVIAGFRILLGFIVAILGSTCLDEVVFKNDIDHQVVKYKQAAIDTAIDKVAKDFQNKITQQQVKTNSAYEVWNQAMQVVIDESTGKTGSGISGVGKRTKLDKEFADKKEKEYQSEKTLLSAITSDLSKTKENAKSEAENNFKENAFLLRIKAMFGLVANNSIMLVAYIIFTLFLFFLEFIVVLIKWFSKDSVDEIIEKARDRVIEIKTKSILDKGIIYFNPEHHLPVVKNATEAMKKHTNSIFN